MAAWDDILTKLLIRVKQVLEDLLEMICLSNLSRLASRLILDLWLVKLRSLECGAICHRRANGSVVRLRMVQITALGNNASVRRRLRGRRVCSASFIWGRCKPLPASGDRVHGLLRPLLVLVGPAAGPRLICMKLSWGVISYRGMCEMELLYAGCCSCCYLDCFVQI